MAVFAGSKPDERWGVLSEMKEKIDKTGGAGKLDRIMGPAGITGEALNITLQGAEEAYLIQFALEKDLFELFGPGKSAAEISGRLGYDSRKTRALLDVYVSMGLLNKVYKPDVQIFKPSAISRLYLKNSSPYSIRELIKGRFSRLMQPAELEEKLSRSPVRPSTGPSAAGQARKDPGPFTRLMVQHARSSGSIRRLTGLVAAHPRFYRAGRVLDLGGSHGLYTAALCHINNSLEGVIFDLPEIIGVTRTYIEEYGLKERIKAVGGDFYQDSFGRGYQVVLAVNVFHRTPEMLQGVLQKIHTSLDPKGVLYLQHRYLNEKRTAPKESALFYLNRTLEVDAFYLPTVREALHCGIEAGFRLSGLFRFRGGDTCLRLEK